MARVQRGNVVLRVSDTEVNKYMAKGFSLIDEAGRVIKQSVPTELGQLQRAYSEQAAIIEALKAENAELKAQLQDKKAGAKKTPAAPEPQDEGWDDWAEAEEEPEEKPKKKKSKA